MNSLWWTGLLFATLTETALQASDVMVATIGDSVTLPCAVSSGSQCSSVTWTRTNSPSPLVGEEFAPNTSLLRDCSLQIKNIHSTNATTYICNNGKINSRVDLRILVIAENKVPAQGAKDTIELHCFLNNDVGLVSGKNCSNTGLLVNWLTGNKPRDNAQIKKLSTRFHFERVSNCFLKLHIRPRKPTDHFRKWRCQVSRNESVKATASYITTVEDGIEEVFAAVDESLSLTCANASSLRLTGKSQTTTSITYSSTAVIIHNVSPVHVGDYRCLDNRKAYTIRLHTFDITSELDPGGQNVTLSCVLTCAHDVCDEDFALTWSEEHTMYSTSSIMKGSLIIKLSIPLHMSSDEVVCSVLREGLTVATKKWHLNNSPALPGLIWITVPLVLLCIAAAGVFCVYRKRKHNRDPEHIRMTHVYEDVKDYELPHRREAVTSNDSFYDLLQAVN